jgi:hypothetical protein
MSASGTGESIAGWQLVCVQKPMQAASESQRPQGEMPLSCAAAHLGPRLGNTVLLTFLGLKATPPLVHSLKGPIRLGNSGLTQFVLWV